MSDVPGKAFPKRRSILGTERLQLDILVAVRIFDAVVAEYANAGVLIDPSMEVELTRRGKRQYVSSLMSRMSNVKPVVVPECPMQTLYRSLGKLVRLRSDKPVTHGGGGKYRYVNRDSATEVDLRIALATHNIEAATRADRDNKKTDVWYAMESFPSGLTLMEAYAREVHALAERR